LTVDVTTLLVEVPSLAVQEIVRGAELGFSLVLL